MENLKISYSMIDNSGVWKAIAVRFSLLDRVPRAAHCANIGFVIPDYSPVLHRLKCPAQWWTLTDGPVLVSPSGEYVYIGVTQCGDALSTQPLALLYTTILGRIEPTFWLVSVKMWMGHFLNVYPNIILANSYSATMSASWINARMNMRLAKDLLFACIMFVLHNLLWSDMYVCL
jgi:hypothetical protein